MPILIQATQFGRLFREEIPLIDVRAPSEFVRGAFPNSTNLPLLHDEERKAVGTCYRQQGRDAAVALGFSLVDESEQKNRLDAWIAFANMHPEVMLYCYRGGLRSTISQQWLDEAGINVPRIAGGYKALRRFLLDVIESASRRAEMVIVAGKTGSGKTHFISTVQNSLDLEARANHRGSAFGRRALPQPSQIDFENRIAIDLLKMDWESRKRLVLEDESRAIGSLSVPQNFHRRMNASPIAVIEETLANRVETIHSDYIQSNYQDFQQHFPQQANELFAQSLTDSLDRIRKRLGGDNYQCIQSLLHTAIATQLQGDGIDEHKLWIEALLTRYYDPMYDYQLQKKSHRIVFRGNRDELRNWIQPVINPAR